jgi:hypothetical protein
MPEQNTEHNGSQNFEVQMLMEYFRCIYSFHELPYIFLSSHIILRIYSIKGAKITIG